MNIKPILFGALLGTALAMSVPAQAQSFAGSFTLPVEAHWGAAVLPAGTYSVSTDIPVNSNLIKVIGNGTSAIIIAPPSRPRDFSSRGSLELRDVNGKYVVAKFTAGPVGREFTFPAPKETGRERHTTASNSEVISVAVRN